MGEGQAAGQWTQNSFAGSIFVKILFLTQFCTPEPIFKSVPFASALRARGHDVRILTGFPNYPGGRVYPGYRIRMMQREILDGVPILRLPLFPSHGVSTAGRAFNYLSFAASATGPLLFGWRPDVVYVYNLVTLAVLAAVQGVLRRVPYVLDVQDIWPDSVFQSGMGRGWMGAPIRALCRIGYRGARRLVTLSPGMARELVRRGVDADRVECIHNWSQDTGDSGAAVGTGERLPEFEGRFTVLYAGNLGTAQGLDAVIDAAVLTGKVDSRIQFAFMGSGVLADSLRARAAAVAPSTTVFLPARSASAAAIVMKQAQALLLHLSPKPLFEFTIPSKTQSYLAMGRPILAAIGRDAAELVEAARGGVACRPGDAASIAHAALTLAGTGEKELDAMGRAGREYYRRHLAMDVAIEKWERVFAAAGS